MRMVRGLLRRCRGRSDIFVLVGLIYGKAPVVWLGFSYRFWLEWADTVAEFVG